MSLTAVKDFIEANDNFAIIGHVNPDGDCVGSCMGLWHTIRGLGKQAKIIMATEDVPPFLRFIWDENASGDAYSDYDAYIAVDCAGADRLGYLKDEFTAFENTVCIDHHRTNVGFASINAIFPDAAAAGEIIFSLAKMLSPTLSVKSAECIYTAIASDTGGFKYSNTTGNTLRTGADLVDTGIDSALIHKMLFDTYTLSQIELIGDIVSSLTTHFDGKVGIISVSDELLASRNMRGDDADFIVSLPRAIEGVEVGVFLKKRGDDVKVSFRSAETVDVSKVAGKLGGGGHFCAAGATIENSDIEGAKAIVLSLIEELFKK